MPRRTPTEPQLPIKQHQQKHKHPTYYVRKNQSELFSISLVVEVDRNKKHLRIKT